MPFCPGCGTRAQHSDNYCGTCGTAFRREDGVGIAYQFTGEIPRYGISLNRVLVMVILSYGLYLFYWFYLTWKQYRDHTRKESFPVWHALTLFVPIYNLFRIHAHMRSFRDLMLSAGMPSTISARWAVVAVMISWVLGVVSFNVAGGFGEVSDMTQETAVAIAVVDIVSMAIVARLLHHVQGNLNRYWSHVAGMQLVSARIGVGEVVFGLTGAAAWAGALASILSAA